MASTKNRRGRAIATGVLCAALVAGAAVAIAARDPKPSSTVETPSIFKTAAITRGDLTTTERIDGTLQLSSTLPVLHRIEGQTSSSTTPPASDTAQPSSNSPINPAALSSPLIVEDCSTTTVATTPESTTTSAPSETTTPTAGTAPTDTTPAATSTTPTTIAPIDSSTMVSTPIVEPCETSTTITNTTTTTSVPDAAGPQLAPTGGGRTTPSPPASSGTTAAGANDRVTQTITSIIDVNTSINRGDVLYTVDGDPVVALDGALPAWRSLSTSSEDGADIAQLEASLVALGYDPDQSVVVDNEFDTATETMVEAWQQGLGIEPTGSVSLGSVVFLPSSTTVSAVDQAVGDTVGDGDIVLTLATPTQEVLVDVPAGAEAQVVPGLTVEIGNVEGTVSRLRSANRNGSVFVVAVITPATAIENATNGSSVTVTLILQNESGVLIAPAEALVSRLDGTYAVQAAAEDGTTRWLTVELLAVSGGNVAIRASELTEGTLVLLPA